MKNARIYRDATTLEIYNVYSFWYGRFFSITEPEYIEAIKLVNPDCWGNVVGNVQTQIVKYEPTNH